MHTHSLICTAGTAWAFCGSPLTPRGCWEKTTGLLLQLLLLIAPGTCLFLSRDKDESFDELCTSEWTQGLYPNSNRFMGHSVHPDAAGLWLAMLVCTWAFEVSVGPGSSGSLQSWWRGRVWFCVTLSLESTHFVCLHHYTFVWQKAQHLISKRALQCH